MKHKSTKIAPRRLENTRAKFYLESAEPIRQIEVNTRGIPQKVKNREIRRAAAQKKTK
jgi:hypothetical protein